MLGATLSPHTINFSGNLTTGAVGALAASGAQMRPFWGFGGGSNSSKVDMSLSSTIFQSSSFFL